MEKLFEPDVFAAFTLGLGCLVFLWGKVADALSPWKDLRVVIKRVHRGEE